MNSLIKRDKPTYAVLEAFNKICNELAESEWNKLDSTYKVDIEHFKSGQLREEGLSWFKRFIFLETLEQLNAISAIGEFIQIPHPLALKKNMIDEYKKLINDCYEYAEGETK